MLVVTRTAQRGEQLVGSKDSQDAGEDKATIPLLLPLHSASCCLTQPDQVRVKFINSSSRIDNATMEQFVDLLMLVTGCSDREARAEEAKQQENNV